MPRILNDPNLAVQPDFASEAYAFLRESLIRADNVTPEQAIEQDYDDRASGNKKRKVRNFEANKPVASSSIPHPSNFALNKLREHDYVELHYFTPEGCAEATRYDRTVAQDAFTFARVDDIMALKPYAAFKPSMKAIPDDQLTWRQMSTAKTPLLHYMSETGWPEAHIVSLATFYLNLENHGMRFERDGEAALLAYHAEVRREWHDALKGTNRGPAFDISIINEERLQRTLGNILNQRQSIGVLRSVIQ
ncbi:hypothetical protein BDZ97DRAFT_1902045 [Flammula alnicola]|nr:hypothetical protein BDZ97DRAFT_1902045 [Flammula alnicola]